MKIQNLGILSGTAKTPQNIKHSKNKVADKHPAFSINSLNEMHNCPNVEANT